MVALSVLLLVFEAALAGGGPTSELGEVGASRTFVVDGQTMLAGSDGSDVLVGDADASQVAGRAGFDVVFARPGTTRVALGGSGVAWATGSSGVTFQLGQGVFVVIGSSGPDVVHLHGGVGLALLGEGDDVVVEHGEPGLWVTLGGGGADSFCYSSGQHTRWLTNSVEERLACKPSRAGVRETSTIVATPRAERMVLASGGSLIESPESVVSGSPAHEFRLDVLGVVGGHDPGTVVFPIVPGGVFRFPNGLKRTTFSHWGSPPPLGETRVFQLYREPDTEFWVFEKPGAFEEIGEPLVGERP